MHCSWRRLLQRRLEFHVCTINKSAHTKKVWKLIECSLYIIIGLNKDDGFIYILNSNGPKISYLQKKISREFKNLGFKIEISSNVKIANFLDVKFDLNNNLYEPFNKNNDIHLYINVNSNYPRCIFKQIPTTVSLRINRLSSSKRIFENNRAI